MMRLTFWGLGVILLLHFRMVDIPPLNPLFSSRVAHAQTMLPPKVTQTNLPTGIISSHDTRLDLVTTLLPSICWYRAVHNPQRKPDTCPDKIPKNYTRFSAHHSLIHKKVQISQYTHARMVLPEFTQITSLTNLPTRMKDVLSGKFASSSLWNYSTSMCWIAPDANLSRLNALLVHRRTKP